MPEVSYVPGALTAVTGDQYWVLVDAAPDSPAVARLWQQLSQGAAADALLVGLLADGGMPGFALLTAGTDGQPRLFCRGTVGAAMVSAGTAGGEAAIQRVDGAGLLTWREHVAAGSEQVFLGEPPADAALRLPAASGVLLAGCVIVDFANFAAREASRKPIVFFPTVTVPALLDDLRQVRVPVPAPAPAPAPTQDAIGLPNGDLGSDGEYDGLWGATQMRTVEGAAIRGPEDDGAPMANGSWTDALPGAPPTIPVAPPPARPLPGPSGAPGGLIDVPPWLASPGESASTVTRGDFPQTAETAMPPDRIGPVVPALICQHGHVNPPSGAVCRRCGAPLPHDAVPVPRPVLGVLRLSLGDAITLDRGVLMGRNPREDFAGPAGGEERPHVVKLPSTGGDVSRTHLQVTLDGWHVLVTDLNSTNGTLVTLPGRDAQQLRPGEPMPIQPGTVVTLAQGIDFRYEVTD